MSLACNQMGNFCMSRDILNWFTLTATCQLTDGKITIVLAVIEKKVLLNVHSDFYGSREDFL